MTQVKIKSTNIVNNQKTNELSVLCLGLVKLVFCKQEEIFYINWEVQSF